MPRGKHCPPPAAYITPFLLYKAVLPYLGGRLNVSIADVGSMQPRQAFVVSRLHQYAVVRPSAPR